MKELYTHIVSADVYRRGAQTVRRGRAELSAGVQTLRVHGLSASCLTDTARLFSSEGISCSDLRFTSLIPEGQTDPVQDELREKIDTLEKHIEFRKLQIELWKQNGDFSSRTAQPAAEVEEYIDGLTGRLEALSNDIIKTQKELKELQRKLQKAEEEAARPCLCADVEVQTDGVYDFEIHCFENSAYWRPVYELRSDGTSPVTMRMKGSITQNTYEDWKGVELSLFTGDPVSGGSVPELLPLYLDIRQPAPVYAARTLGAAMRKNAAMEDTMVMEEAMDFGAGMAAPMAMAMMSTAEAKVEQGETATEYKLPGRRDVLRGGEGTMADIQTYTLPAEYRIVTVPSLDQSAYLVAVIKPADLPVTRAIECSVYLRNIYSGKVWLDPDLTKEEAEITLGREERIFVSRKEVRRKTSTTLLRGQKVVEYGYEIALRNDSGAEAAVIVKDQLPVSENKDIEVQALELSGAEKDAENGLLTWNVKLAPSASETIKLGYTVSHPKDKLISEHRRRS